MRILCLLLGEGILLESVAFPLQESAGDVAEGLLEEGILLLLILRRFLGVLEVLKFPVAVLVLLALGLSLVLHPPVLEPDFDLSLS